MSFSQITESRLKELLHYDPDTGVFRRLVNRRGLKARAGAVAGWIDKDGYRRIEVDGRRYSAHRLAWFYVHGAFPNKELDHRNGVRDDNRIANLREATPGQNQANSKAKRNGLKGVCWNRRAKKWQSNICIRRKLVYLGLFRSESEAHAAYYEAAQHLFGEFARSS